MRSARGDLTHLRLWRSRAHRGGTTHGVLARQEQSPGGFLLPHCPPGLVPGTRRWTCCLLHLSIPRTSPQLGPHPLFSGPWSPLPLLPPSFRFLTSYLFHNTPVLPLLLP